MKQRVIDLLKKEVKLNEEEISRLISVPPTIEMGDFSFPCFSLAKIEKKSPILIAETIAEKLRKDLTKNSEISNIDAKAGYVNFFLNKNMLATSVIDKILKEKEKYGKSKEGLRMMVEFASPNTNKPLHLGHLRNLSIGESVSRIIDFSGDKIIKSSINNDRGVHICKSMVAYDEFGKNKQPDKKSDHFVGDFYVMFAKKAKEDPSYEEKALEYLKKWEEGDKKIISLWKKMNKWALDGFKETYKLFGISFDKEYYESEIYKEGKEIVQQGLDKGIFSRREDGAVFINLEKENLGEKVLLRPDGTSIYITQDLYLAVLKDKEYKLDGSIYVVGNEQEYHFKVLFSILKKLGYNFANKLTHLSYGMVELPEGKMKSREGTVVDADDLIANVQNLSKEEIEKRYKDLSKKEIEERSLKISLAAIKYTLLKTDIKNNMMFNPKESISFEGNTGPYLLYSYARANSIVKKVEKKAKESKIIDLKEQEIKLIKELENFPQIVKKAYNDLAPNLIANYAFDLSQSFNEFYHACPVLGNKEEAFRLKLVEAFKIVLKSSLNLLGIQEIDEM